MMMERAGRSDRAAAQATSLSHPTAGGSRSSRGKAHRHDSSAHPLAAESPQEGRRKDSDMLDRYPQYIGRHGVGIVVLLKDSFGFVKVVDEHLHQQLFFHVSEVLHPKPHSAHAKPDLRTLLKVGDEIEFTIEPSRSNDGRLHAKQVKKLKAGTVISEEVETERRTGIVQAARDGSLVVECVMSHDAQGAAILKTFGFTSKATRSGSGGGGGGGGGRDVAPSIGDVVEFSVATDRTRDVKRATQIEVIAKASTETTLEGLKLGHVIKLSEEGGEIRQIDTREEVRFSQEDMQRAGGLEKLTLKCEVSFALQDATAHAAEGGRPAEGEHSWATEGTPRRRATNVTLLPPGTITSQATLGQHRGTIVAMPTVSRNVPSDGVVEYTSNGATSRAAFSCVDIHEFISSLQPGDRVEYELVKHKFVDLVCARNVTLLLKQPEQGVEYGRVSVLKKNFGFIKCCSRVADMFFHVNALAPDSDPIALDADVAFVPVLDEATDKLIASAIRVVPSGTAVFDVTSELEYEGVVKVTAEVPRGTTPGAAGILYACVDGRMESLPYLHKDLAPGSAQPTLESRVLFHVVEDRRAVVVSRKSAKLSRTTRAGGRRACAVRTAPDTAAAASALVNRVTMLTRVESRGGGLSRSGSRALSLDRGRPEAAVEAALEAAAEAAKTAEAAKPPRPPPLTSAFAAGGEATTPRRAAAAAAAAIAASPNAAVAIPRAASESTADSVVAKALAAAVVAPPAAAPSAPSPFVMNVAALAAASQQRPCKGTVVRLVRANHPSKKSSSHSAPKSSRPSETYGVVRPLNTGSWSARKRSGGGPAFAAPDGGNFRDGHSSGRKSEQHDWDRDSHRLPGDALFYLQDVAPEHRDTIRVNDEVDYILVPVNGEARAFEIRVTRSHKPSLSIDRAPAAPPPLPVYPITPQTSTDVIPRLSLSDFHPPGTTGHVPSGTSHTAPPTARKKFTPHTAAGCFAAVPAKGPDGTSTGFAAGRGKPLPVLPSVQVGRSLSSRFKLADAIAAAEFVPKGLHTGTGTDVEDLDLSDPKFNDSDDSDDEEGGPRLQNAGLRKDLGSGIYRVNSEMINLQRELTSVAAAQQQAEASTRLSQDGYCADDDGATPLKRATLDTPFVPSVGGLGPRRPSTLALQQLNAGPLSPSPLSSGGVLASPLASPRRASTPGGGGGGGMAAPASRSFVKHTASARSLAGGLADAPAAASPLSQSTISSSGCAAAAAPSAAQSLSSSGDAGAAAAAPPPPPSPALLVRPGSLTAAAAAALMPPRPPTTAPLVQQSLASANPSVLSDRATMLRSATASPSGSIPPAALGTSA